MCVCVCVYVCMRVRFNLAQWSESELDGYVCVSSSKALNQTAERLIGWLLSVHRDIYAPASDKNTKLHKCISPSLFMAENYKL